MSLIPDNWIREDFLALALHYAARADLNISVDEKDFMQNRCGKAHCEKAKAFSEGKSDYEIIKVLTEMKETFFPGEEGTSTLKGHLVGLFKVDDDYSHLEHNLMLGLDRLWQAKQPRVAMSQRVTDSKRQNLNSFLMYLFDSHCRE